MEAWAGGRVLLNLGQWPRWDFVFGLLAISIQETVSLDGFHVATRDPAPPQALGTESGGSEMDLGVAVGAGRSLSPERLGSVYKIYLSVSCCFVWSGRQVALL